MKAVIFDMDGVLVNSEPFWQLAEREVYTSLGVEMKEALCEITKYKTTQEVAQFWYNITPWKVPVTIQQSERMVIERVKTLIQQKDCIIPGIQTFIQQLKTSGFKIGLATNAPFEFIPVVLQKLELSKDFDAVSSSEQVRQGKPAPDVYLRTLKHLKVKATNAWAIEDSNAGLKSAQKAGLKVAAFSNLNSNPFSEHFDLLISDFSKMDIEATIALLSN